MSIPDFSIEPPVEIALPATTSSPVDGPSFEVSRNSAFSSNVTFWAGRRLRCRGDRPSRVRHPSRSTSVTPPATGQMSEPTFTPNGFLPSTDGSDVDMLDISTNAIPEGIYTVWLEGQADADLLPDAPSARVRAHRRRPPPVHPQRLRPGRRDRDARRHDHPADQGRHGNAARRRGTTGRGRRRPSRCRGIPAH